jgi:hypothetical protein
MVGWFLFAIIAFLVFGVPAIDELYRLRARRAANLARQTLHEAASLVPDQSEHDLPVPRHALAELDRAADYADETQVGLKPRSLSQS